MYSPGPNTRGLTVAKRALDDFFFSIATHVIGSVLEAEAEAALSGWKRKGKRFLKIEWKRKRKRF